jgi:hypothetical protein
MSLGYKKRKKQLSRMKRSGKEAFESERVVDRHVLISRRRRFAKMWFHEGRKLKDQAKGENFILRDTTLAKARSAIDYGQIILTEDITKYLKGGEVMA